MMRLLLIRHGHTADTDALRYAGHRDVPLSALGERQARALSARLAPEPIAAIFTSDLSRARVTADTIAAPHGLIARQSADLREIAMGAWEGKTYAELAQEYPERLEQWMRDPEHVAPPGGETASAVRGRVRRVLGQQRREYQERTIAWITHGGVIGVLLCDLLGVSITRRWRLHCDLASITTVELLAPRDIDHADGDGSLRCLNDTNHLRALL